jgi:hypothetical protein
VISGAHGVSTSKDFELSKKSPLSPENVHCLVITRLAP